MEKTKICMGCFEELPDDTMVCSICGFDNKTIKREVQRMVSGCGHRKEMAFGMPFQSKRYIYDMESMGQCAGDKMLFARA